LEKGGFAFWFSEHDGNPGCVIMHGAWKWNNFCVYFYGYYVFCAFLFF
jgi:hypothetical protein